MKPRKLTSVQATELMWISPALHEPVCVCVQLMQFYHVCKLRVASCSHHHNQDTELLQDHEAPLCYSFIDTPAPFPTSGNTIILLFQEYSRMLCNHYTVYNLLKQAFFPQYNFLEIDSHSVYINSLFLLIIEQQP